MGRRVLRDFLIVEGQLLDGSRNRQLDLNFSRVVLQMAIQRHVIVVVSIVLDADVIAVGIVGRSAAHMDDEASGRGGNLSVSAIGSTSLLHVASR